MESSNDVLQKIRLALGRNERLRTVPVPPKIDEPIVRLVHSDVGLPELFARQARKANMGCDLVRIESLLEKLTAYLQSVGAKTLCLPVSPFLQKIGVVDGLRAAGFTVRTWDELTADDTYTFDVGITDAYAAVAETGTIVIRPTPSHGRVLSLVPPIHVAILEPRMFVPDLVDLFEKVAADPLKATTTLITGPSKTSDIEGNLVTGVHGPGAVQIFVLS
jgi:L-lactate utilization protein LutC